MLLLIFVHKYVYNRKFLPDVFQNYFSSNENVHDYNTRGKKKFHIAGVSSSYGQRCTAFRACKFWNNLPDHLKKIPLPTLLSESLNYA